MQTLLTLYPNSKINPTKNKYTVLIRKKGKLYEYFTSYGEGNIKKRTPYACIMEIKSHLQGRDLSIN